MDGNPVEKTGFHGVDIQNILRGEFSRTDPELWSLYTYDAQGNLVEASENGTDYHYTHDTEGRVLSKRAWGKTLYENHYDAEGYRDSITEKDKVTNFVYQGGMLLHELDEDKNPARHYVLGNEYIGLDNNYYLTDEQGSVRYVLDAAGNVQNDYWYDAFGQCIAGHENIPNRLRYNAQIEDDLTGLYYLRARYYNTGIGRFTQEDVIYNDGLNLYAYCSSNPVMYADPSGYKLENTCITAKEGGSKKLLSEMSDSELNKLGYKRHSDGSIRDSKGHFAGNSGTVPGTPGVDAVEKHLLNSGYYVNNREISVKSSNGTIRRYDIVVSKDGKYYGIEVKSGSAKRTKQQIEIDKELLAKNGLPYFESCNSYEKFERQLYSGNEHIVYNLIFKFE